MPKGKQVAYKSSQNSAGARSVKKESVSGLNPRFANVASHIVDPGHTPASLAPSLCPSRAGSVTFPIVVEVTGLSSFCVIAQPDITKPLMITHPGSIPETNTSISGTLDKDFGSFQAVPTAERVCVIESERIGEMHAMPLTSALACTLNINCAMLEGSGPAFEVGFWIYDVGAWNNVSTGAGLIGGGSFNCGTAIPFSNTATHYAFTIEPVGVTTITGGAVAGSAHASFTVAIAAGTASCAVAPAENVFDIYTPEWDKILDVADKISIPYMDTLVTYQGSTLDNQGAIAVCATSEEISMANNTYYSSVAARPFDMYEGRLASAGESQGGGHWHLLHDNIAAYSLSRSEDLITGPRGYFAIKGMDPTQTVRVMAHITLNYYTIDPAFSMKFQPPWGETDLLLYTMRTQVPLVSSNDSHLSKLVQLAKRKAAQAGKWALENPEKAAGMAMLASQVVGPLFV